MICLLKIVIFHRLLMVFVCLPEGARLKASFQVVYLRLATFGGCFVLMQVAPADFLTYGYGSCTAKISGDTANSARRLWCTVGMLKPYMYHVFDLFAGCWWFDLKHGLLCFPFTSNDMSQ